MKKKKVLALLLSMTMVAGMVPTTAFAETEGGYKPGVYTGRATVVPTEDDKDEDGWDEYQISINVTIGEDGKINNVAQAEDCVIGSDNASYFKKALEGTKSKKGIADQVVAANGTEGVNVVSSATRSSDGIIAAINDALAQAVPEEEPEFTYLYAGLTWAEYWENEGVYAAGSTESSDELDSHNEHDKGAFDVVSRATANHGLHRGSFQCNAIIYAKDGTQYSVSHWSTDGKTLYLTDGSSVSWSKGTITKEDGSTSVMDHYEIIGTKYVPVRVATADLDAFCAKYATVKNGEQLVGGYAEGQIPAYDLVASVDENTNGLKYVTKDGDDFTFSEAHTGSGSGIADTEQKKAEGYTVNVREGDDVGSFGEFIRVDLNDNYGELGSRMQSTEWTYYGDDSTYTDAKATFGTKFAADNWMHKSMGIQLGLTESARFQLPEDTDGTGYWSITIRALGYADTVINFKATEANLASSVPADETDIAELQALVDQAKAASESDYTETGWKDLQTELSEGVDMLAKETIYKSEIQEQINHLKEALENKVVYLYAGLTWEEYWENEGVYAAGSTESSDVLDSHGEYDKGAFDVVSRATSNHGLHRGSFQCNAIIYAQDGTQYSVSHWSTDGKTLYLTDGTSVGWSKGTITRADGSTAVMDHYEIIGTKYVPVRVAAADLDDFCAKYATVKNGGQLVGGYAEGKIPAYDLVASVDADTNGLKYVTRDGDDFVFSEAHTGSGSGIADAEQKTAEGYTVNVREGEDVGSFGEFIRVDLNDNYGELGSRMQSTVWTYYGNDSTRTDAKATFGTKFAADNWMHKSMGIQLGLTESARFALPEGTNGTGYWTITIRALGYADTVINIEVGTDNLAMQTLADEADIAALQALVDQADAKKQELYTEATWANLVTEREESREMLQKTTLYKAEVQEQIQHLTEAIEKLELNDDAKAAAAAEEKIAAIGTVTTGSEAKIKAARSAYNALTDAQKKLVSNYKVLQDAEAAYENLTTGVNGFVNRLYENILGRKADQAGFDSWVKVLKEGKEGGSETVANFVFSKEYEGKKISDKEFVTTMYKTILGRNPDQAGLDAWLGKLENGMTRRYVVAGFTNSSEFAKLCASYGIKVGSFTSSEIADQNDMATAFVSRLYTMVLGRQWDRAGIDAWTAQLVNHEAGAGQISKGFFFSKELESRKLSNKDFVTLCYHTYLDRNPDQAGLDAWVKLLNEGSSKEEILDGFINSPEFGKICAAYGINK